MFQKHAIVIKAYKSYKERKEGGEPMKTVTVCTLKEFDSTVCELIAGGRYLAFETDSGAKIASRLSARYFLSNR